MVAAAVPFMFSELINVRQFGVGLAIAVLLDALIVRPVLLPAAVQLLGRAGLVADAQPASGAQHHAGRTAPGGAS